MQQKINQELLLQTGGKLFQKQQLLYIVATISDPKLKKITKKITDKLIGKNIKPYRSPHITCFHITINGENEDSMVFQDEKFYNKIKRAYDQTIINKKNPMILTTKPFPKGFTFPGYRPKYFLKNYKPVNPQIILDFRQKIFDLIEKSLGKPKITVYDDKWSSYYIYSYNGRELFAESSYYDTWKPHIDFLNDFDIEKNNPKLFQKLGYFYSNKDKVEVLLNEIKDIPQDIYNEIDMSAQMRNMTYAIDHIMQKKFR